MSAAAPAIKKYDFDRMLEEFENSQCVSIRTAFRKAIAKSYKTHPMRNRTAAEDKRRFGICYSLLLTAAENNEPVTRALDLLPQLLGHMLDDVEIEFNDLGAFWVSPDTDLLHPISSLDEEPDFNTLEEELADAELDRALREKQYASA